MAEESIRGLTTPYYDKMDRAHPWDVYPRPNLKRDSFICLNGEWEFEISKVDDPPRKYTKIITVPFPPESELSGIGQRIEKSDFLYYRRTFTLPEGFIKDRLLLRFGAVDRYCTVKVNGKTVGTHNCGYLPFYADITELVRDGENEICVKVKDDLSKIYPYGKQKRKRGGMWYTPVSGIWQTVWLESVPEKYVRTVSVTPTVSEVRITVDSDAEWKKITLKDGKSYEFYDKSIVIRPENPVCWSPENPYLYEFTLETETDKVESYFALREVGVCETENGPRLSLNGKPYLFNGLLDQGYFPDGIFLPATPEGYEEDIRLAKSLGFNTLRKHIKVEPPIFYYLCDKIGIAVFQDMVNNSDYSFIRDTALPTVGMKRLNDKNMHKNALSRAAFEECMAGTVNSLYNNPSVVYYTIFNEGWGQYDADTHYENLKAHDPTRIIDSTSGWFWQKKSDVLSHHVYFKKITVDPPRDVPVVVSEFGGYSHRVEGHLFGSRNYGYASFSSREDFGAAIERLYLEDALEGVRCGVSALIYTQLSDIEDETNGFITYDRRVVKIECEKMTEISKKLTSAYEEALVRREEENDEEGENK